MRCLRVKRLKRWVTSLTSSSLLLRVHVATDWHELTDVFYACDFDIFSFYHFHQTFLHNLSPVARVFSLKTATVGRTLILNYIHGL